MAITYSMTHHYEGTVKSLITKIKEYEDNGVNFRITPSETIIKAVEKGEVITQFPDGSHTVNLKYLKKKEAVFLKMLLKVFKEMSDFEDKLVERDWNNISPKYIKSLKDKTLDDLVEICNVIGLVSGDVFNTVSITITLKGVKAKKSLLHNVLSLFKIQ